MFELSYALCLQAHFHKHATNYFSNVNKNPMISDLWLPLKALLANKIQNVLLKPRGSSQCCLCTSLPVPVPENIWPERVQACVPSSHTLPAHCWGRWALLVPAITSCPLRHWLCQSAWACALPGPRCALRSRLEVCLLTPLCFLWAEIPLYVKYYLLW